MPGPTQAEVHSVSLKQGTPHEGQKSNPPKGGKATSRSRTEEEHRPDLRQVTQREDQEHHRTKESRGTAAPRGQADKYLTKTRVTTSTAKLRRVDNQGSTLTTPSHQQTLEARGKNPRKDSKKIPGA